MTPRSAWSSEIAGLARLAAPVVGVQVGLFLMNFVDTVMVGHLPGAAGGEAALACVAVGGFYHWMTMAFFFGTLMALDPLVAQAVGAKDEPAVARALQRGVVLALAMTGPAMLAAIPAPELLRLCRQPEEVVPRAAAYAWINATGVLPFLAFVVFRQTVQAMHRARILFLVTVGANLANVLFNWVLIFGHLGFPGLGVAGAAWATALSRWLMAAGLLAAEWRVLGPRLRPWLPEARRLLPLVRLLRLGAPIGVQYVLEFGIFGVALLMMGRLGIREQEGHQIALNLASFSFMFPLGISAAAAVRVGHAVGRGDAPGVRRASIAALAAGFGVMAGFAGAFLLVPGRLASIYTPQPAVITMAAALIPIAGLFQVFDGLQVVSIGVLRGLGDTTTPAVINILGFWILGLPVSLTLAFPLQIGARGVWWGLVAGLAVVAGLLVVRVRSRLRRAIRRVTIDDESPATVPAAPGA